VKLRPQSVVLLAEMLDLACGPPFAEPVSDVS
jgi:hypothetical protein